MYGYNLMETLWRYASPATRDTDTGIWNPMAGRSAKQGLSPETARAHALDPMGKERIMFRSEELRPWMKKYAAWLALHDGMKEPTVKERMTKVSKIVRGAISREALRFLEERQDFHNLVADLKTNEQKRARFHMEIYATEMIDMHREATKGLMAEEKYDKIAPLTTPYLDRVWPKQDEQQQQAQIIQINLGGDNDQGSPASLEEANVPTVEAVEIEAEEVEEDDDL